MKGNVVFLFYAATFLALLGFQGFRSKTQVGFAGENVDSTSLRIYVFFPFMWFVSFSLIWTIKPCMHLCYLESVENKKKSVKFILLALYVKYVILLTLLSFSYFLRFMVEQNLGSLLNSPSLLLQIKMLHRLIIKYIIF